MSLLELTAVMLAGGLAGLGAGVLSRMLADGSRAVIRPDRLSWLLAAGGAAALAASPSWQHGLMPGAAQAGLVGLLLLVLACDVRQRAVYPLIVYAGISLAVAAGPLLGGSVSGALLGMVLGAAVFASVYVLAAFRYGAGAFGGGDVYAAALLGAVVGVSRMPLALGLAAVAGAGLALVVGLRARSLQATFPYAPSLCLAALLAPLLS